ETNLVRADEPVRHERVGVPPPAVETPNVGQVVEYPPADVVARCLVFPPGVAETENDFQRDTGKRLLLLRLLRADDLGLRRHSGLRRHGRLLVRARRGDG